MKIILITLFGILSFHISKAQTKAVTEKGDEVILYSDGTWKYTNDSTIKETEIKTNDHPFIKDKKSTFLVKSNKVNVGIWIDPKAWTFSKNSDNEDAEFQFQKKDEDLYALLISEKMEIPVENLKSIAFDNAKSAAPDIKIINEEYRTVNGIKVLMLQMAGTIQGMRFTYYGYYYSSKNGTIQFLAYTGESLFEQYKESIENLLNGLVEI